MESTGEPGKIQISLETAEILKMRGKEHWFVERDGPVATKGTRNSVFVMRCHLQYSSPGKGYLETFWLDMPKVRSSDAISEASTDSDHMSDIGRYGDNSSSRSQMRLIEWSVKSLTVLIKKIIVHRQGSKTQNDQSRSLDSFRLKESKTFFHEVAEIIELPPPIGVDIEKANLDDIHIDYTVIRELRELVRRIAAMHNDNPFHNFEHANHVTLSIIKLLSRIVEPSDQDDDQSNTSYGITSDPLTQFACCFSSLIHDLVSRCTDTDVLRVGAHDVV